MKVNHEHEATEATTSVRPLSVLLHQLIVVDRLECRDDDDEDEEAEDQRCYLHSYRLRRLVASTRESPATHEANGVSVS